MKSINIALLILCTIVLFSASAFAALTANDVLAYWKCNDNLLDSSGKGNTLGQNSGTIAYAAGKLGKGCEFDNDRLNISATPSFTNDKIRTIELWVKFSNIGANFNLFALDNDDIYYSAGTQKQRILIDGGVALGSAAGIVKTGEWYNYVYVVAAGAADGKLYINGILNTTSTLASLFSNGNFYIGSDATDAQDLIGILDNVIVYNATADAADIAAIWNSGSGRELSSEITNTSFNITNYNDLIGMDGKGWNNNTWVNVSRNLLTGTFTLSTAANASCSLHNLNYTSMIAKNANYKLATTEATAHSFTLYDNLTLFNSSQCVYCAYSTGTLFAQSGCLKTMFSDILYPYVNRTSQQPIDINQANMFGANLLLNFNITERDSQLSSIWLYAAVNNTKGIGNTCINGVCSNAAVNETNYTTKGTNFTFTLEDNDIYMTATYNLNEIYAESTLHSTSQLTATSNAYKIRFYNFTPNSTYNIFEIMAKASADSEALALYFCNETYVSGNYKTNNNCAQFGNIPYAAEYNHSHPLSSHHVRSIPVSNNQVNGVGISSSGLNYIIITNSVSGISNYSYLNNNSGSVQLTINTGTTWSNQAITIDAHIHKYDASSKFCYYAFARDIYGNRNWSETYCDTLSPSHLFPSAPAVLTPIAQYYKDPINISYINSTVFVPEDTRLVYYNLSLYTETDDFVSFIYNNSLNLSYKWNLSGIISGKYRIRVAVVDNWTMENFDFSDTFIIDNITPNCSIPVQNGKVTGKDSTITSMLSDNINISWAEFQSNMTDYINTTIGHDQYNITTTITINGTVNSSYFIGYNITDYAGLSYSCRIAFNVSDVPAVTPEIISLSSCPSTTLGMILFVFIFIIAMTFILIGALTNASTIGIFGSLILMLFSFIFTSCESTIGVILIVVSLLMIIGFGSRMVRG